MADLATKPILPYLEGREGELRIMRFWSKVDMGAPDQCWDWQGSATTSGYGRFKIASYVSVQAHRVALVIHGNEERRNLLALHSCDRPSCCNPHHLRWGTVQDNSDDKVSRARHRTGDQAGFLNPRCTLTPWQLAEIVHLIDEREMTNGQIGDLFGLTHSMISKIRTGNSWQDEVAAIRAQRKAA